MVTSSVDTFLFSFRAIKTILGFSYPIRVKSVMVNMVKSLSSSSRSQNSLCSLTGSPLTSLQTTKVGLQNALKKWPNAAALEFHIQRYVDIDRQFNTDNYNDNDNESDKVSLICWIFRLLKM